MLDALPKAAGLFCAGERRRRFSPFRRRSSRPHTRHYAPHCPPCRRLITPHLFLKGGIRLITISLFRGQSVTLITVDRISSSPPSVLVFLLRFLRQSLERKDTRGRGEAKGEFRMDVCAIFDRGGNQQAEILKDTGGERRRGQKGARREEGREI